MAKFFDTPDPSVGKIRFILVIILVFLCGVVIGVTGKGSPDPSGTPQSCLDYIDHADQGFLYSEESLGYAADALDGVSRMNIGDVNEATDNLKSMKSKLDVLAPKLLKAKAECKEGK